MPSLARKVLVCAAADGLILQPLTSRKDQRPAAPIQVRYGDAAVSTVSRDAVSDMTKGHPSFESFGIVGPSVPCAPEHSRCEEDCGGS